MPDSTSSARGTRLFWTCVVVGLLQLPALYLVLRLADDELWRDGVLALSAGVAASAIWWSFFARYAEREGKHFLTQQLAAQRGQLERELKDHRDLLNESIQSEAQRWRDIALPRDIYPAAEGFDLRFNGDLTTDLRRSHSYFFQGPTGVYVPARILLRPNETRCELREVRMRIVDPRNPLAMEQAIADRRLREVHAEKSADQIREEIIDDIFMTLAALWEARHEVKRSIRVWYESTALIVRVELLDEAVYDSSIDVAVSESFPLTVAWSRDQATWVKLNEEFRRQKEATAALTIIGSTPTAAVQKHIDALAADLGRKSPAISELAARYRNEYLDYLDRRLKLAIEHEDVIDDSTHDEPSNP